MYYIYTVYCIAKGAFLLCDNVTDFYLKVSHILVSRLPVPIFSSCDFLYFFSCILHSPPLLVSLFLLKRQKMTNSGTVLLCVHSHMLEVAHPLHGVSRSASFPISITHPHSSPILPSLSQLHRPVSQSMAGLSGPAEAPAHGGGINKLLAPFCQL